MLNSKSLRICGLAATLMVATVFPSVASIATADIGTPALATVVPEQTAGPTTVPSVEVPTPLPTVISEVPNPESTLATTPLVPTVGPVASATAYRETQPLASPTSVVNQPTVGAVPTAVIPSPAATPVSAPWPSPSELRQNARLRWGHRIPASVRRWAFLVVPAAKKYHIDPNLIAAVMTMESNGDPLALSPADARGLMQILHGPWDPKLSVDTGARMLSELHAQFGDWSLVLAAYNAGPGAVEAAGGIPPFRETRDYVIVVGYLWDLYGHHRLSVARRTQYRRTLGDLTHFKDQRKKVAKLARIAHVANVAHSACESGSCIETRNTVPAKVLDPFWPIGGSPDPLQHVGPVATEQTPASGPR